MINGYIPVLNEFHFIHMVADNTWVYPGFPIVFAMEKLELHYIKETIVSPSAHTINGEHIIVSSPEELRSLIHVILVAKS